VAEVRKRLFTPFGERFTIDVPSAGDMEISGDLFSHEFTIGPGRPDDRDDLQTLAGRDRELRGRGRPGEDDVLILASVLAQDLAIDAEDDQ
jgi:hypothetical protein